MAARRSRASASVPERFSGRQRYILWHWVFENIRSPYPTNADFKELSKTAGLSNQAVRQWFGNHRRSFRKILDKTVRISSGDENLHAWASELQALIQLHWMRQRKPAPKSKPRRRVSTRGNAAAEGPVNSLSPHTTLMPSQTASTLFDSSVPVHSTEIQNLPLPPQSNASLNNSPLFSTRSNVFTPITPFENKKVGFLDNAFYSAGLPRPPPSFALGDSHSPSYLPVARSITPGVPAFGFDPIRTVTPFVEPMPSLQTQIGNAIQFPFSNNSPSMSHPSLSFPFMPNPFCDISLGK